MASRRPWAAVLWPALSVAAFAAAAWGDPSLRPERPGAALALADTEAVVEALAEYQRVYQDLFASSGRPDLIDAFPASRDVKHHVFRDIHFVRDAGLIHVQDLAAATVLEVVRTGRGRAEAVVFEEWNYVLQQAGDRRPASGVKGMGQGFRYRLRREGGRWLVAGWEPEDVTPPPQPGGRQW
jgi:hypothetical protein